MWSFGTTFFHLPNWIKLFIIQSLHLIQGRTWEIFWGGVVVEVCIRPYKFFKLGYEVIRSPYVISRLLLELENTQLYGSKIRKFSLNPATIGEHTLCTPVKWLQGWEIYNFGKKLGPYKKVTQYIIYGFIIIFSGYLFCLLPIFYVHVYWYTL